MALPEWLDRLRTASYVSPEGVESAFKIDILTRIGGKKVSNHEILNTNESIPQDQGNRARRYPLDVYFVGETGDQEADTFFESLHEKYTVASPGTLKHPAWGDIPVMPFSDPQQSHNLVNGAGIFRVAIEFITVPDTKFPTPEAVNQSEIIADIDTLEDDLATANDAIDIDDTGRFADFRAKIIKVVDIVDNTVGTIAAEVDTVEDTFNAIKEDIDSILAIGVDAVQVMSQVNNLIRVPGQIIDSTINKVQAFAQMAEDIKTSFVGFFSEDSDRTTQINDALIFQDTYGIATAALVEASLFTEYDTRDQAGDSLDSINTTSESFDNEIPTVAQTLSGGIAKSFSPDHNSGLTLSLLVGKTNAILLDRSFSLKARKDIVLTSPSDPITLTWQYYQSVTTEKIEFFINTNNLTDVEMIEIPAGREIVVYV